MFINGPLAILKNLKCLQLKKQLNNKEDSVKNEPLCVVLGSYSHLTRSYRHLNSG